MLNLLVALLSIHPGGAADSDVARATPVTPAECTFAPRPVDDLRALTMAELPWVTARLQGTPAATPEALEPQQADPRTGTPADQQTFDAAQEIVRQIAACTNAGNLAALFSLYDDEGAGAYLAVGFLSFSRGIAGEDAPIDPLVLDTYLASLQLSAPIPDEDRISAYRVDSVTVQEDELVYVVASFARGDDALSPFAFYLREDDGQYRIAFGAPEDATGERVPEATPRP